MRADVRSTVAGISLRPATAADLRAVEQLLRENQLPTAGVAESIDDFIVAESTDGAHVPTLVGVIGLEIRQPAALLRSAAVARPYRGRGVGARLVEHVVEQALRKGATTLYLLTTTAESWFPAFGFAVTSRDMVPHELRETVEFTGACPASAVVMWRSLDAAPAG